MNSTQQPSPCCTSKLIPSPIRIASNPEDQVPTPALKAHFVVLVFLQQLGVFSFAHVMGRLLL